MKKSVNYKIGYSDIGGIYIGNNIQSDFHKHHIIAIIISYGKPFEITLKNKEPVLYRAALIQKEIKYKLKTSNNDSVVFIHIDPYSEIGLNLAQNKSFVQDINFNLFSDILNDLKDWEKLSESTVQETELLIHKVFEIIIYQNPQYKKMDERIAKCIQLIKQNESDKITIKQMATAVNLSTSRFAHLFKQETGVTFRRFVLSYKLVKSLKAMHKQHNFTESSFIGGFADQAHFTKTFKNAFGIKPSSSKK